MISLSRSDDEKPPIGNRQGFINFLLAPLASEGSKHTNRRILGERIVRETTLRILCGIGRSLVLPVLLAVAGAANADAPSWEAIEKAARGQTVYWNGWGGDEKVNAYIAWVGEQVKSRYGITLRHVKVTDIAETVSRILAEKYAGRDQNGTVDLIWINGENFHTMKQNGLLFGPFSERLPYYPPVDTADRKSVV